MTAPHWGKPEPVPFHVRETERILNGLGEVVREIRVDVHDAPPSDARPEPAPAPALVPVPLNPECEAGKHGSCFMDAWDDVEDAPALCECPCHTERSAG
ncbi:hypothetical protein [Rathayibacter sp. AY1E1]|uniref:hypothetical protein n=1 Tax=Rathayibacter sp. AY1E1 TaxID=2080549 RepID=UPI000CE8BBF5|nr:hypothetical protein [Rathayibacter sp. AY1E1]PPH51217.1 hypothetical protein C5C67_11925 [Rathayibacter sp. AY1E1]